MSHALRAKSPTESCVPSEPGSSVVSERSSVLLKRVDSDESQVETDPSERVNEEDSDSSSSLDQLILPGLENSPVRVEVQRHDDHNLDIRSLFEFDSSAGVSDLRLYVYMPPSAHLSTIDKSRIMGDFFSRGRVFYSGGESMKNEDLKVEGNKIISLIRQLRTDSQGDTPIEDKNLTAIVRIYGAILGELTKTAGQKQKRFLMVSHSLLSQVNDLARLMNELSREIRTTYHLTKEVRDLIDAGIQKTFPVLKVLENYIHHLYVDYIGTLQDALSDLKQISTDPTRFQRGWEILQRTLNEIKAFEAVRSSQLIQLGDVFNDRTDQERVILRYSHMKKFFQSTTFIDVARKEGIKRLNEPVAAFSAALAMFVSLVFGAVMAILFLGGFEQMTSGMVSLSGMAVIVAVAVYTIKDRLKESIRKTVLQRISKMVADVELDLYSEGKKLGSVSEWFAHKIGREVPEPIEQLRRLACISEPEKHLHEDILFYRKEIRMERDASKRKGRFFQDLLRINFERYLKHFDDHEKSFRFLDQHGNVSVVKTHRVYHFHLGLQVKIKTEAGNLIKTQFYRIIMDKNGIDRVEELES